MPKHNIPFTGESQKDFIVRCIGGGGDQSSCQLSWERALSSTFNPLAIVPSPNEAKDAFYERCKSAGFSLAIAESWWNMQTEYSVKAAWAAAIGAGEKVSLELVKRLGEEMTAVEFGLGRYSTAAFGPLEGNRFRKDILTEGVYVHPLNNWVLDINGDRLKRLVATFNTMKANGVPVEIVVDHSTKAEDVHGYVDDFFIDPDGRLMADMTMTDDTGVKLAKSVRNVSVMMKREFVDGKGRAYGEAITHVAIVQQPVMPDQEEFVQLSLTGKESTPILSYLCDLHTKPETEDDPNMEELLKGLRTLYGIGEEVTDENLLSRITEVKKTQADEKAAAEKKAVDAEAKAASLQKVVDDKGEKPPAMDPNLLEQLSSHAQKELESLVTTGKVDAATCKALSALSIGEPGSRNEYALSCNSPAAVKDVSLTTQIFNALKDNKPVALGQQTGEQLLTLVNPAADADEDKDCKETADTLVAEYNGTEAKD